MNLEDDLDEDLEEELEGIAVIGMSGRFPGAPDIATFWRNLQDGLEAVRFYSDEEMIAAGVAADEVAAPGFVKAGAVLDEVEHFDAGFFGYTPREAQILDPQMRLFLQCAWETFEDAGYDPAVLDGPTAVYAGMRISDYLLRNIYANPEIVNTVGHFQVVLGNDKDYLAPLTSYKLNLRGPSITVQTACSTALVAIHLASEALNNRECDLALAGASTIRLPQAGYHYHPAGIFSKDGHCRAFDAAATGTIFGNGVGAVLLKRLEEAVADGDRVLAVIRGSAVGNDGSQKVGFTAPSVAGQAKVVADAHAMADIEPGDLGYIECHGTGTALGDPIEIKALRQVFEAGGADDDARCLIGSVKSGVGHLEAAAGIASLIKTVLMLRHGKFVPSLHFENENPETRLSSSPLEVCRESAAWASDAPRLAAVSSFGIGGTNAHVVIEEGPAPEPSGASRTLQLLVLSGRDEAVRECARARFLAYLEGEEVAPLADVAFTLQQGRRAFGEREAWVLRDAEEARAAFASGDPSAVGSTAAGTPAVVFLFPGQGAQYAGMGAELYETEPVFRENVDACAAVLQPLLGYDPRGLLFPRPEMAASAAEHLRQTERTQPALFVIEYALARLWMSWGVRPAALLGHSVGEYVAACLAEVFSLEDALALVAERGRLMQSMPRGAMLSVELEAGAIEEMLDGDLELAVRNSPDLCAVSGSEEAIEKFAARLEAADIRSRRLQTSHGYHSAAMEGAVRPFTERVRRTRRGEPRIPMISNLTGAWLTPEQAADPAYWAAQMRGTVLFRQGIETVAEMPGAVYLEVGPGRSLGSFVGRTMRAAGSSPPRVAGSLPRAKDHPGTSDTEMMLRGLARLWTRGVEVDWKGFSGSESRHRVALPTYPFKRERHWIDPPTSSAEAHSVSEARGEKSDSSGEDLLTRLTAIWRDLLGFEEIAPHDDFFELGGHSLLATRLLARVGQELGIELTLESFFDHPTPSSLAKLCAEAKASPAMSAVPVVELPPLSFDPEAPARLSASQERLWFLQQLYRQSPAYNLPGLFVWEGEVDRAALAGALGEIVRRHETLRSRFPARDGRASVVIDPPAPFPLPLVDLTGLEKAAREARARRLAREEALRPFDVENGPVVRAFLMTFSSHEHRLSLNFHHLIADGWSFSVLWRESRELYAAALEGRVADLPELPVQYRDYARWQRSWLDAPEQDGPRARLIRWWRDELEGVPQVLDLPTDHPRPQVQGHLGFRLPFDLGEERSAALAAFGREHGATVYMTLLAAFEVLLGQTAGTSRFLVGTNVANRNRVELEGLIGLFVNQVVLRAELGGRPSFSELVERTRARTLAAFAHQELPLEKLLEALEVRRDLSYNALFQVMFVVQNLPVALPAAETAATEIERVSVRHDLRLEALATTPKIHGVLEAREELFEPSTIARMTRRFETLIVAALEQPEIPIDELPRLTPSELHELLVERRGESLQDDPNAPRTVSEAFYVQVSRVPDAVALACGTVRWSYAGLARRTARLAAALRARGVGPETAVGIALSRSAEMMIAVLGVLEAGGAYVPLDPGLPEERRSVLIEDSDVELVLDSIEVEASPDSEASSRPEAHETAADNLAYILYTSGSTGRPKGVMISHRQILSYVAGVSARLGLTEGVYTLMQPLSVDLGNTTIFPALLSGGCLRIFDPKDTLDPRALRDAFRSRAPDVLKIAPSHLKALQAGGAPGALLPRRRLIVGGEAPEPRWIHALAGATVDHRNVCRVFNHYGPTETTVGVLTYPVPPEDAGRSFLPTGSPLPGVRAWLADHALRLVPLGVPGILVVGGSYVARGYFQRPTTTAGAFVPDPFSGASGERLYVTGDLMRWGLSRRLEFLGRADHQVKIRGFRVELGEIEAVAMEHEAVEQALVLARDGRLIAYFGIGEAAVDREDLQRELQQYLSRRLPDHMVPGAFMFLPELPLSVQGKISFKDLPRPDLQADESTESIAPRTETERLLARVWETVLGCSEIGIHDNFFRLGGDSILSIQVAARADREGARVTVQQIFEHQTIAGLAAAMESEVWEGESWEEPLVPIQPEGAGLPFFCIHPAGGTILSFLHLAREMGDARPFFAVQDPAFFDARRRRGSVEELAASYVEEARKAFPEGPYDLCGHSLGGVLAFEMALQMRAAGDEVARITLLDVAAPHGAPPPDDSVSLAHLVGVLCSFRGIESPITADDLAPLVPEDRLQRALQALEVLPEGARLDPEHLTAFYELYKHHLVILEPYRPAFWDGPVTLVRAREVADAELQDAPVWQDPDLGWGEFAATVERVEVAGNHTTMLRPPHVVEVAKLLGAKLPGDISE